MNRISRLLHKMNFLARQRRAVKYSYKYVISKRAAGAWTAINFVLCLALWLVSCGRFYLQGPPLRVLEGLCQGLALTSPQDGYPLYYALSWSPLDPILTVSLFQAALLVASFALLWLCV